MKKIIWSLIWAVIMFFIGSNTLAQPVISTVIESQPPAYVVPGHRFTLEAVIIDPEGIIEARCYFSLNSKGRTLYVPMEHQTTNKYRCTLPAFSDQIEKLTHFFLVVNGRRQVIRSTALQADSNPSGAIPRWQKETTGNQPIQVFGELKLPDLDAVGVDDGNAVAAITDPSSRYGLLIDAYTKEEIPAEWNAAFGYFGGFIFESKDHSPRPVKGFGVGLGSDSGLNN